MSANTVQIVFFCRQTTLGPLVAKPLATPVRLGEVEGGKA
jgi:hypothetical protein